MSDKTKVMLSAGELAMAADSGIILTKRAITEAASALFSSFIPVINEVFKDSLSSDEKLSSAVPKISKGENYKGFPYVIMDHPASFEKGNIFAVRTMFWWGHFISITLHISGIYKKRFADNIMKIACDERLYVATGDDEWQHYFEEDNFVLYASLNDEMKQRIMQKNFIKIALKYELHQWNMMQSILPEGYNKLKQLLILNYH